MMQVMNPNHMAAIAASQNQPPVEQVDLQQQNTRGPVKLFVGQVPGVCTEEMLQPLFQEFGTVMEVSIMRDKTTNRSKGSAWVTYADRSSAETAISMLHNQHIIPPQTNPLQIKLANSPPQIQSKMMHSANNPLFGQQQHILKQLTYLNKYGGHTHPSRGGRKVFIGQIPRNYTSAQLEELMGQYGTIEETVILQDKATGVGRGCAFVVYSAREEAQRSIEELHGKKSLPPMANPMQVSLAEGEMEDQEPKLFVGMVPYKATEADIHQVFEHYGEIIEVALLKAPSGMSRGCAFVKYGDMAAAEAAVQNHGNFKMEGGTSALTVKFADSEKEKKKRQKQSLGRLNMMGGQMGLPGMGMCGISGGMPGGAGMPGNAIPGGMPGGMGAMGMGAMGMGAMGGMAMGNMAAMGGAGMGGKGGGGGRPAAPLANIAERKASGPPGANCFILHLPLSWGDDELREHFLPFGEIISATVFRDRYSGHAKGFGFVSYADPESAQQAITAMSGYQIPGHTEKLKVQLKNNDKAQQGGGMRRAPAPAGVPEPAMAGTAAPAPSASIPPIPAASLN